MSSDVNFSADFFFAKQRIFYTGSQEFSGLNNTNFSSYRAKLYIRIQYFVIHHLARVAFILSLLFPNSQV
jgi:hypothetical protein